MSDADFDAIVNDPRFAPFHGWHDDHAGSIGAAYKPAVQQVRAEFLALADAIKRAGLIGGRCLQLGLGHAGGSHLLFGKLFAEVWTVEAEQTLVNSFRHRFPDARHFIVGNTHDPAVWAEVDLHSPFDFLFIDAGHLYADVSADYLHYCGMVHHGGVIAFHDAVQRGPGIEVYKLIANLVASGRSVVTAGGDIGTAWMTQE